VQRPQIAAMFRGPGPAKYRLPGSTGLVNHDPTKYKKPAWSFGGRHIKYKDECSPGPAYLVRSAITRTGVDGTPHYSLYGKATNLTSFRTPAPGTYAPEKQHHPSALKAPSYSFGSRTPYHKKDNIPAPNNYSLPTVLGAKSVGKRSAASYSMTGRSKIGSFHEDLQKTPGPGTYRDSEINCYRGKAPYYSMNGRNYVPGDSTLKPGPGAHSPERVYVTKKEAPRFSFGIRHSEYLAPLICEPME